MSRLIRSAGRSCPIPRNGPRPFLDVAHGDDLHVRAGEYPAHLPDRLSAEADAGHRDLLAGREKPGPPSTCRGTIEIAAAATPPVGPVPRVLLRDSAVDAQLVQPRSPEMPDLSGGPGRYHLVGEIARGKGAVIKGRDVDLGRDLAIKVILRNIAVSRTWSDDLSRRHKSEGSYSIRGSSRFMSWADSPTAGYTSR